MGGDEDLAQDFTLYAFEQIKLGKYTGKGKFSHWVGSVFSNFSSSELNKLTREKKKYVGLPSQDKETLRDQEQQRAVEEGYHSVDAVAWDDYRLREPAAKGTEHTKAKLDKLAAVDRAYVAFLEDGQNQMQAAQAMGESTITSRKRESRIREALQAAFVSVMAA